MDSNKKKMTGLVVSDKMDKTIVVEITARTLHPLYKKYVVSTKRYKAHDENNDAHTGDKVTIVECRHFSKDKCWRLEEVIERAR